jgi:GTP-binding protein
VILRVNPSHNTLFYFKRHGQFKAEHGERGGSSDMTGANAKPIFLEVPPGTIVRDADTGELIADLVRVNDTVVVARGGRGGRGNAKFATASNRAPRIAEKGEPGEERNLKLELKLIADVGIVGVPNAGKSSLLAVVSNAKPKIADYPFTTLEPNLGVVVYDFSDLVFADIPGLIEGAHLGIGLGHAFLRHVQRTRILVHVLNGAADNPLADYKQINAELALFDDKLGQKPQIVVFNKMDLPEAQAKFEATQAALAKQGIDLLPISTATRHNLNKLIQLSFEQMAKLPPQALELEEAAPLYQLEDTEPIFTIERDDEGNYVVRGKRIERAAAMTYWDFDEAVLRFQRILETLGISAALKKAGVQVGDTVFIGEFELEWTD